MEDSGSVRSPRPVIVIVGSLGDFVVVVTSLPSRENMDVFGAIPVFFCFSAKNGRKRVLRHMRTTKAQISLQIRAV